MARPLTFHHCAGDVFWNTQTSGGSVYCSPEMIADLREMLFQEALDGAQTGDLNLIRSANQMTRQLTDAEAQALRWREAARVKV